ncbi:MAG: eukaryotic-like serine/threonine-protein kinase [Candidatus Sumerlaeota bacterium]|nr:eukaryotic-like serine/threonine-protein kinase [Candidatus Sumerlaeota bacterium]
MRARAVDVAADFEDAVAESYQTLADASDLPETVFQEPRRREGLMEKLSAIAARAGFEVEQMLGRGGMGAVLLALDRRLGRRVAIKFLTLTAGQAGYDGDMLQREAEKASRLTHPNVVQVYSWHQMESLAFFVMEYVEGDTLQQYVQREYRISVIDILRIMAEAAAGVEAAHKQGIVHRDIKPPNILIANDGRVKVADFGLASTTVEEKRGHPKKIISGTLGFMAPEQARGEGVTFASDVYSLAASLYYALAKVAPYGVVVNSQMTLQRNQAGDHTPLTEVRQDLHPLVYQIVETGMQIDPAFRYPSAGHFRRALEDVLLRMHDEPETSAEKARKLIPEWFTWQSLVLGLVLGVGLGVLGAVAFMYY